MRTLLLLLFLTGVFPGAAQEAKQLEKLEPKFQQMLTDFELPGFAVAVVQGDQTIYAKGFGYRDLEKKLPMDANTLLAMGSTTKAFTSALLGMLREEGKLKFDDRPAKHIPELRFQNDELNEKVTIKELMTHQTGIPRHDASWYLFPIDHRDSLVKRLEYHEPFNSVLKEWNYNNFMYMLQGVITERITGKSWEENMRERILKPLEMNRSTLSIDEMSDMDNVATGYELTKENQLKKVPYYHIRALAPAGSLNSSVTEMAKWIKVWLSEGGDLLSENYVKEAMSSQAIVSRGYPDEKTPGIFMENYGYGWAISSYRGAYRVQHGGAIDGFNALITLFPTENIGLVVLTNRMGSVALSLVRNMVADEMLGLTDFDWYNFYMKEQKDRKELMKNVDQTTEKQTVKTGTTAYPLQFYAGNYEHPGYGRIQVKLEADSLKAYLPEKKFYLKPLFQNVFETMEYRGGVVDTSEGFQERVNFKAGVDGKMKAVEIDLEPAIQKMIEFKYSPPVMKMNAQQLVLYEGEYEIGGQSFVVSVRDDNKLVFSNPGQFEDVLQPIKEHKFLSTENQVELEFKPNSNGAIKEILISLPDGRALMATKK